MFEHEKIILLGENLEIDMFRELNIVGIISSQTAIEGIPVYDYSYLLNLPKDEKIVVADNNWDFETTYEFNNMLSALNLRIGEDYIYESMRKGQINTNKIYRILDYNKESLYALIDKLLGGGAQENCCSSWQLPGACIGKYVM